MSIRKEIYQFSLRMLKDYPFGIGPGNFSFHFYPYTRTSRLLHGEYEIITTPHNEILRWGIESEWLCLCFILVLTFRFFLKFNHYALDQNERAFLVTTLITFIPQLLFQFPFENAFPFGYSALLSGYFLSRSNSKYHSIEFPKHTQTKIKIPIKIFIGIFSIFIGLSIWARGTSEYLTKLSPSASSLKFACEIFPLNFYACSQAIAAFINEGNISDAEKVCLNELKIRPFNYIALKHLFFIYFRNNQPFKACQVAQLHDDLFFLDTSLSSIKKNYCGAFAPDKSVLQFKELAQSHMLKLQEIKNSD